jgi:predicted nucleic acid-binding protein
MILVDSNVILDIVDNDPQWSLWSSGQLRRWTILDDLAINTIIYAEISPRYLSPADVDQALLTLRLSCLQIPRAAAFLAGKAHMNYRRNGGSRSNVLPDFFIGAHATTLGSAVLTRDVQRYTTYFPKLRLITP